MSENSEKKARFIWNSHTKFHLENDVLLAKEVKFRSEIDEVDTEFCVNIQFKSYDEVLEYAVKRVVWNLQQKAQKKQFLPSDELRTVDTKGNYAKSLKEEISELSREQMLAYMKVMQEMLEKGK